MPLLNTSKLAVAAVAAALLTACGGGGDSVAVSDAGGYTVESGVAQKGPLAQGSVVTVDELTSTTLQPNGKEYTFRTNNNLGTFSTSGITFGSSYLSTLASGYYFNEITGAQSNDTVVLSGLSQVGTGGDTVINVNALSSMAVNRVTKLATSPPAQTFAAARTQAQRELLAAFYIYNGTGILTGTTVNNIAQPANLTALDLSKSRAGDQMLAAMSGVVMTAGVNGNGVNTLLSQIAVDLGDDGLLNNSANYTPSVSTQLCAAADLTNFAAIATNLNNLYGTKYNETDLSQWVDTSGCVDKVIDRYKFTASDVRTSTVSKSPAYVAGPDDVGQCFSVGNATTGATAKLYYKGSTTAAVGTQKAALGDSMSLGLSAANAGSFAAYIQRSSPDSTGACPATVPTSGLTRVHKYTIATVPTYTIGGTVTGLDSGQSVTLLNNGGNARIVSANGTFTFTTAVVSGGAYAVTVGTQPSGKTCTATNASGTVAVNVSNVSVSCGEPISYVVSTVAGTGAEGYRDGAGTTATFSLPVGIAVDSSGSVYVADVGNDMIRKITAAGVVSRLAGLAGGGSTDGDNGYNSSGPFPSFNEPTGVAVDSSGNVYVADKFNHKIRKITPAGVVSTIAGGGARGSADGVGTAATFDYPNGIAVDRNGVVYVSDTGTPKIRKITPAGVVSTLAGTGVRGGSDGAGATATFYCPWGVAVDSSSNLYIADACNIKIRKITSAGVVSTLAGTGVSGSADGAGATAAFNTPAGVAVDARGNIYVADASNHNIRKITPAGVVSTIAGTGAIGNTDGPSSTATFNSPWGLAVDGSGNIYVADSSNNKIRKLTPQNPQTSN